MTEPKWYEGIPPVEVVTAHETDHPRPDGIRLGRITVTREENPGGEYLACDDRSYGEWIVAHPIDVVEQYASALRLKAVNGEVFKALGFTSWMPLSECRLLDKCRYFPVGPDGLPTDYAELRRKLEFTRLERDNRTSAYEVGVKLIGELRQQLAALQERNRWRPIEEMHEDHGPCVCVNLLKDAADMEIHSIGEADFDETEWTHFSRVSELLTKDAQALIASLKASAEEPCNATS